MAWQPCRGCKTSRLRATCAVVLGVAALGQALAPTREVSAVKWDRLQPFEVAFEAGASYGPRLEPVRELVAGIAFLQAPAEASECGICYHAGALFKFWDAFSDVINDIDKVERYVNTSIHAQRAAQLRTVDGTEDRVSLTKGVCVEPIQFALFVDDSAWRMLSHDLRTKAQNAFDWIGTYPAFPLLKRHVPEYLQFMQLEDPTLWLKRLVATMASPFPITLMLDTDAMPCRVGWEEVFALVKDADVANLVSPAPWANSCHNSSFPFPPINDGRWSKFHERNLGTVVLNLRSLATQHLLVLFLDAFLREVTEFTRLGYHDLATKPFCIHGDQVAYREALYMMRPRLREERLTNIWFDVPGCKIFHTPHVLHFYHQSLYVCASSRGRDVPYGRNLPEHGWHVNLTLKEVEPNS